MLSVVIPTYNINCSPLVKSLIEQLEAFEYEFEIICVDDASTNTFKENEQLDDYENVSYIRLDQNVGRSHIRNLLASTAKYKWLLFLDADTLPTNNDFIKKYLSIIKSDLKEHVIFGGLAYRIEDVVDNNYLRFEYGRYRESIPALKRSKSPYTSLLMSNTLVKKSVFDKVEFNSNITLYGHEDALFSHNLYESLISVKHIDNPVYHTGIETNDIFIKKSKTAVVNLWNLYLQRLIHPEINKLLRWYLRVKLFFMLPLFSSIYKKYNKHIERKLSKKNPSLLLFDLYRLSYLCYISKVEK